MVGKSLSHYQILEELGRGGMGIVYKAEDTKLDRTVAIKVLPAAALASDDDRARFYREAKAAAQLHHPHIASVFEIDEAVLEGSKDDEFRPFIAMEFIEGETLHDRIQKGPLKLEEAVRIASQIASGLEAAHEKNIVHRDIKSGNVMLTAKGEAKILDFGLAQTAASTKLTRMGSTVGTIGYMSPEQARGEEVDRRTDIWSLGVVLYEMISGHCPFPGEYEQAVVYEILNQEPDPLTSIRTGVPMDLENLVDKCLRKERKHRYQHADDLVADLGRIEAVTLSSAHSVIRSTGLRASRQAVRGRPSSFSRRTVIGLSLLLIALSVTVSWLSFGRRDPVGSATIVGMIDLLDEQGRRLELPGGNTRHLAVSPDGSKIVFLAGLEGESRLYVKEMDSFLARPIPGTEEGGSPAFSPDGNWLAYCDNQSLNKVQLDGTPPIFIAEVDAVYGTCRGVTWVSNEILVYVPNESSGLWQISLSGTSAQQLTVPDRSRGEISHRWPHALSDQSGVIFTVKNDDILDFAEATIGLYDFSSGTTKTLLTGGTDARVIDSGSILYANELGLRVAVFNTRSREVIQGTHRTVVDSVFYDIYGGSAEFAVAENGTLIFFPTSSLFLLFPTLVRRNAESIIHTFENPAFGVSNPDFSRDDQRLVIEMPAANNQLYLGEIDRPELVRFTQTADNYQPVWEPGGDGVAFISDREGGNYIYRKSVLRGDSVELLFSDQDVIQLGNWTPDGRSLVFVVSSAETKSDIWMLTHENRSTASPLVATEREETSPQLSRDGTLLAYISEAESGEYELYAQAFTEPTVPRRIAANVGNRTPRWDELKRVYFVTGEQSLVRATISINGDLSASEFEEVLPELAPFGFDISKDGQTILTFDDSTIDNGFRANEILFKSGWDWLAETSTSN